MYILRNHEKDFLKKHYNFLKKTGLYMDEFQLPEKIYTELSYNFLLFPLDQCIRLMIILHFLDWDSWQVES